MNTSVAINFAIAYPTLLVSREGEKHFFSFSFFLVRVWFALANFLAFELTRECLYKFAAFFLTKLELRPKRESRYEYIMYMQSNSTIRTDWVLNVTKIARKFEAGKKKNLNKLRELFSLSHPWLTFIEGEWRLKAERRRSEAKKMRWTYSMECGHSLSFAKLLEVYYMSHNDHVYLLGLC